MYVCRPCDGSRRPAASRPGQQRGERSSQRHPGVQQVVGHGPERLALFDRAKRLAVAYAPYKLHCHRYQADLMAPGLIGYRRPAFWNTWWHLVDMEPSA